MIRAILLGCSLCLLRELAATAAQAAGVGRAAVVAGLQHHRLLQPACLTRRQACNHVGRAVDQGSLYELGHHRYKLI